ncbi:MAG: hypothetical protein AAGA54_05440 [Myxococcota bacterium]
MDWMRIRAGILLVCAAVGGCSDDADATGGTDEGSTSGSATTTEAPTTSGGADVTGSATSSGGSSTTTGDPTDGEDWDGAWPLLDCDPLVPSYCGYPFPNNVFTVEDDTATSGRRLALAQALMPATNDDFQGDPFAFNERDGFSPGGTLLAHLPGATADGLPDPLHIGDSLADDSPTVVLDVDTGERLPHFAEIDVRATADDASLMIQPAVGMEYGHRYIVAVRGVVDGNGAPVEPSPAFAALRDGTDSDEPSVDARRGLYGNIFDELEAVGVTRDDLQLAWDFTVASREDTSGRLLAMRDAAIEQVGDGPTYEILSVDEDVSESIYRRIRGEIEVPLFLDDPGPGGVIELGKDGAPVQNGTARYGFTMMVPYAAQAAPAPGVLFGHGLFGNQSQVEASAFGQLQNAGNIIFVGLDWIGMSSEDPSLVGLIVANGTLSEFRTLPDRLQQSLVNFELASLMLRTSIVDDPALDYEGSSMLDGTQTIYYGGSQGGIMGASYMAIATEVTRGVLAVPGQPYNLLLERSVNFDAFADIIGGSYPQAFDQQMLLALVQLLWDRAEPSGYARHIITDTLPNTPSHEVLLLDSIGDHQVTTLGAHVMARSIGIPLLAPAVRDVWGLEEAEGADVGSALVEYDFGLRPEPLVNEPMREGDDPHGALTEVPAAVQTATEYMLSGDVVNYCDGACDPG